MRQNNTSMNRRERQRKKDREGDRERDRDTETERQTERDRETRRVFPLICVSCMLRMALAAYVCLQFFSLMTSRPRCIIPADSSLGQIDDRQNTVRTKT